MPLVRRLAAVLGASVLFLGGTSCSLLVDTTGLAGAESAVSDPAQPDASAAQPDGGGGSITSGDGGGGGALDEYGSLVLTDGPSLYYRFEDTAGDVRDETGAHHGRIVGSPQRGVDGAFRGSRAVQLRGGSDGINVGDVFPFAGREALTMEAWFKPDAYDSEFRFVFSRDYSTGSTRQSLGIYIRMNQWAFERYVDGTSRAAVVNPPPAAGTWYHVVTTYDGTSIRVYLDGELRSSGSDTRSFKAPPTTFYVGRGPWNDSGLRGVLDEVAIYEKALSPDRIKAHYEAALRAR